MKRTINDFLVRMDGADGAGRIMSLRHDGVELTSATDRKALLERLRAGEHIELDVEAVTYIQRKTPNRKFVRFKAGQIQTIAKGGAGIPFLRNHDQHDVMARGGTVTASKAVHNDDGDWEFHQALHLVKPWAVEGWLDGTIDRFSVGWRATGPVICSVHETEVFKHCRCWAGDLLDDGRRVEFVYTAADLVETSTVNVPAVVGTHPTLDFRAELSAHLGGEPPIPQEEPRMFKSVLKALGLSADAAEESVLAAVEKLEQEWEAATKRAEAAEAKLKAEREALELQLKAEREANERTSKQLADFQAREADALAAQVDAAIDKLYTEGRLVKVQTGSGAQPDAFEATLREVHAKLGQKAFEGTAARLPAKVPVGKQAGTEDRDERNADRGADVIVLSERQKKYVGQLGMTEETFRKNLEKGVQQ